MTESSLIRSVFIIESVTTCRSVHPATPCRVHQDPFVARDRPEHLVHARPVTAKRPTQDSFAAGTDLLQRAVAAAVLDDRARFEAVHGQLGEHEVEYRARRCLEDPGAPELGPDRESPFRQAEGLVERADLDETDCVGVSGRHDAETDVAACRLLAV